MGFSSTKIEEQLARIQSKQPIASSPKLARFLQYVVHETLEGRSDQINQYSVAVDGLGLDPSFDPVQSPTIRASARRLRRALDDYYSAQGTKDHIRISLPKGSYVPVFEPIATDKRGSVSVEAPEIKASRVPELTLAVVAFENDSQSENDAFAARGLTAEILVALTKFQEFTVLGPLTFDSMNGAPDLKSIRDEYLARFALLGAVRKSGKYIRITAELVNTVTGHHLWGNTYNFDLDTASLFAIEDEVTAQISGAVADDLGIVFRDLKKTSSNEARPEFSDVTLAVLAYNNAWETQAPLDWERAFTLTQHALEKHPENARLLALISNVYYAKVLYGMELPENGLAEMTRQGAKAISLEPDLQIARYNSVVQNAYFGRAEECIKAARKVVDMNPNNARILAGCAIAVSSVGGYDLSRDLVARAKHLNPHYPSWYNFVEYLFRFRSGDYENALKYAERIHIEGSVWHSIIRGSILGKLGRMVEAKPYCDHLAELIAETGRNPVEMIRPLVVTDEHVSMLWDGLEQAGLAIPSALLPSERR